MKKITAAYWHKDGLEIYSYVGQVPFKLPSGPLADVVPVKRKLGIYALIVGKDRLMHVRKRYPPALIEKLTKAVALEIGEIFPLVKPAFYCRIFKAISNYVELDIWAWEATDYKKLKDIFPFSHVIPEDVLFTADATEVNIFQYRDIIHMLAHAREGFIDSTSVPAAGFNNDHVSGFLFNLSQAGGEVEKIRIYGLGQLLLKNSPGLVVIRNDPKAYPPCIESIARTDLREFKVREGFPLLPYASLFMRIVLYLVAGYALMLFLTVKNYEHSSTEIRRKIGEMNKTVTAWNASKPPVDYSDAAEEVNVRLQKNGNLLKIMNMLAQKFPEGTFLDRILYTENNVELQVSSKDPLMVVKKMGGTEFVKKVTIKGALAKDKATGFYNFAVILELKAK
jgi:hypothetical protein